MAGLVSVFVLGAVFLVVCVHAVIWSLGCTSYVVYSHCELDFGMAVCSRYSFLYVCKFTSFCRVESGQG